MEPPQGRLRNKPEQYGKRLAVRFVYTTSTATRSGDPFAAENGTPCPGPSFYSAERRVPKVPQEGSLEAVY